MGRISIGKVAMTQMACMDMKTAASVTEVLEKIDNYTLVGGVLNLNKARMATLAKFELQ